MSDRSLVSPELRARVRLVAVPIALLLGKLGLTPNALTIVGFLGTCVAAIAAASQAWVLAGVLVIAFGIFDLFDGALARATGQASRFGAFLDSTLDRTGESLVLAGVAYGCAAGGLAVGAGLAALALTFASVVTYTRAKAEALGVHGEVGVAPRPERLVILAAGLVLAGILGGVSPAAEIRSGSVALAIALGIIAVLSAITVIQRIVHVREQLDNTQ
ncbi:MAG TPA: CDP-alcohol phosphatidyltransferase family protein [Candidatus Limnocylindria bacterium]|nr:CDP-alcohol phosphatidyltransferase family protein [Candidatus Limnocylindria bacterium]